MRALKYLGAGILLLFAIVLGAAGLVWMNPGWVLNTPNLQKAQPWLERRAYLSDLQAPSLHATSEGLFTKRVTLNFTRACVPLLTFAEKACVKDVRIDVSLAVLPLAARIHTLHATLEPFTWKTAPVPKSAEPASRGGRSEVLGELHRISWNDLELRVAGVTFIEPEGQLHAEAYIHSADSRRVDFEASAQQNAKDRLQLSGKIESDAYQVGVGRSHTQLNAHAEGAQGGRSFQADLTAQAADGKLGVVLNGDARIPGLLSGDSSAALGMTFSLTGCRLDGAFLEKSPDFIPFQKFGFDCPVEVRPVFAARVEKKYAQVLPKKFRAVAHLDGERDSTHRLHAEARVVLEQVTNPLFKAQAEAHSRLSDLAKLDSKTVFDVDLKANVAIPDFLRASRLANEIGLLVPTPFHVLSGPVNLELSGNLKLPGPTGEFIAHLGTRLKSAEQVLDLQAGGNVKLQPCEPGSHGTLSIDLVAEKTLLRLPDIDYTKPPNVLPDARFVQSPVPGEKIPPPTPAVHPAPNACVYDVALRFRSGDSSPIRLQGPLLKNPIPLSVDVSKKSTAPPQGNISIRNFATELFRRKATVEKFDYNVGTNILDGSIRVDYSDYKIHILVTGTPDSVQLNFESDPDLSRQNAISVLLFGHPLDDLDDSQAGSVVNADAAAKNGALGLASLYLFASTPIESIGYNPQTQGLTAKVKLGNGTSLNVGANEQSVTDVGITHRLSSHWRIENTVRNPNDSTQRANLTLLEWFRRF